MARAPRSTRCYHCGVESADNIFKYYNNGKRSQARYQCCKCQKFFTLGSSAYPQGRSYAKQRNVDPPELRGLPRECPCCGVANNAPFKYYNNKNLSQPRFKCLSCGLHFQMRLVGTGDEEKRLVHTSSHQRTPSVAPKSVPENEVITLASMNPWMPVHEEVKDFPFLSDEDSRYLDLIEAGLKDESEAPPPEAVLRLQLWASKLPQACR